MRIAKLALAGALGLMFLMAFSLPARADTLTTYTINFTHPGGPLPTGSFTYDSTNPLFTNFVVVWNGVSLFPSLTSPLSFDLTGSANDNHGLGLVCGAGPLDAPFSFEAMSQSIACNVPLTYEWVVDVEPHVGTLGGQDVTFAFIESTTGGGFSFPVCQTAGAICAQQFIPGASGTTGSEIGSWSISAPEPDSLPLLGSGLLALGGALRRRRLA
jgi:hypothetical protein